MTTQDNTFMQIFDLVAATREKKGLKTVFNPLAEGNVPTLQELVDQALKTAKAEKDISLREGLLAASGAIERYNALPTTVKEKRREPITWAYDLIKYVDVPNKERPRTLSKMQKNIYKTLKPHVTQ